MGRAYKITEEYETWNCSSIDQEPRKCLVIMPIGKKNTVAYKNNMQVFNKIIKPSVEKSGYNFHCYHADLIDESGNISKQIFEGLRDNDLVIADLRRNNINVIYELGIRHTFRRRSILICSNYKENFFHSKQYRAIKYNINGSPNIKFYERIRNQIRQIIENPDTSDNPVSDLLKIKKELIFDSALNAYVNEKGDRFCISCYCKNKKEVPLTSEGGYIYKCSVCGVDFVDSYKKKEIEEKIRRLNENRVKRMSGTSG